jgi:hypothetical protein
VCVTIPFQLSQFLANPDKSDFIIIAARIPIYFPLAMEVICDIRVSFRPERVLFRPGRAVGPPTGFAATFGGGMGRISTLSLTCP